MWHDAAVAMTGPTRNGSVPGARPTAIDLYSGAGGLSLGLEQAGFDVVAAAEIDPIHAATHLYNFPQCQMVCGNLQDISSDDLLTAAEVGWRRCNPGLPWLGKVDAVVGGPPCQGFSVGGVRDQADLRNGQLRRFSELVIELRPTVFLLENVAGLLEARFESFRDSIFQLLTSAGYSLVGYEQAIDAVDFGVPQRRRRVLIFGARTPAVPVGLNSGGSTSRVNVRDALAGLPPISNYRSLLRADSTLLAEQDLISQSGCESVYTRRLSGLDTDPEDYGHAREWNPRLLTNSLRTVHSAKTRRRFARTLPGSVEPISRLYRLNLDQPARTLRAGTGAERGAHTSPRPIHPVYHRVITVREAARLHGYPDWFRFHVTNWHGHRQVGNSVPPPLGRAAGAALLEALGKRPTTSGPSLQAHSPLELLQIGPGVASDLFGIGTSDRLPTRHRSLILASDAGA